MVLTTWLRARSFSGERRRLTISLITSRGVKCSPASSFDCSLGLSSRELSYCFDPRQCALLDAWDGLGRVWDASKIKIISVYAAWDAGTAPTPHAPRIREIRAIRG